MDVPSPVVDNSPSNESTETLNIQDDTNMAMETSELVTNVRTEIDVENGIKTDKNTENGTTLVEGLQQIKSEIKTSDDNSDSKPKEPKRGKRKRCRPIKRNRKRKINKIEIVSNKVVDENNKFDDPDTSIDVKDDVEYCLTVSNVPKNWSFMDIKNFIDTECGPVDEIEMVKDEKTGKGSIRLSFQTEKECKAYMDKLQNKKIDENQLSLEMTVVSLESDSEVPEASEVSQKPWKPDLDSWELDLHGMYGLKLSYLASLNITPPLDKWVRVTNFRCDKSELRDVMEMAGNVLMFSVFTVHPRYAHVMYSHPLEAVQAVSMLHQQTFYGHQLKVYMDKSPLNTIILPKGLSTIGKGLGMNGKPLRNIVKHYERFVDNKDCLINTAFFDIPANHSMNITEGFDFCVRNIEDLSGEAQKTETNTAVTSTVTTTAVQSKPVITAVTDSKPAPAMAPKPNFIPIRTNANANFRAPAPFASHINGQGNSGPRTLLPQPFPRPGFSGPGPRPGWGPRSGPMNGPHPRPMGPMGPRSMGPMGGGPMGGGPMGGGPMGGGPMGGGPMGGGPMGGGPMGGGPMGPGPMAQMGHGPMGQMGAAPMGQMGAGAMGQMGTVQAQAAPMAAGPRGPAIIGPGPIAPPGTVGSAMQKPFANPNDPVKLCLTNLPPTTTFAVLCEKMSEWGHVVSIQLTTPGCAVVTFANRMQADACCQYYNGRKIDNHFIQVGYA